MKLKSNLTESQLKALKELGLIEEEQLVEPQPWEKYPNYKSCWENGDKQYYFNTCGDKVEPYIIYSDDINRDRLFYGFSSRAHAKRVRAEMILKRIADKWNEGIDKEQYNFYTVSLNPDNSKTILNLYYKNALSKPIRFNNYELAKKSLELFPELWDDYLTVV